MEGFGTALRCDYAKVEGSTAVDTHGLQLVAHLRAPAPDWTTGGFPMRKLRSARLMLPPIAYEPGVQRDRHYQTKKEYAVRHFQMPACHANGAQNYIDPYEQDHRLADCES